MANSVTQEQITKLLDESETQEYIFWRKELVISYKLKSGFTVLGRAACVDPANFVLETGRKYAREDAENQLWKLEGYLLQNKLHEQEHLLTDTPFLQTPKTSKLTVRAKFKCTEANLLDSPPHAEGQVSVKLEAVIDGSEENKAFWKYTPSGEIALFITNPSASSQFKKGSEYYVDFTLAE